MIFFHLAHLYNNNKNNTEQFNAKANVVFVDDDETDDGESEIKTYNDLWNYLIDTPLALGIVIAIIAVSVAAAICSFYLNNSENQPWSICICCAINAFYFNIFYFIFLGITYIYKFSTDNAKTTYQYIKYLNDGKSVPPKNLIINEKKLECLLKCMKDNNIPTIP
jgi:hypothetical protein